MKKGLRYILTALLLLGLILVRHFEAKLFYDPLLEFFKTDHSTQPLPQMMEGKLLFYTLLRYTLNTVLSLGILWLVFRDRSILQAAILIYVLFLLIFTVVFWLLLQQGGSGGHLPLFYVRRFLIQPILLLLLLPAFYFHKSRR